MLTKRRTAFIAYKEYLYDCTDINKLLTPSVQTMRSYIVGKVNSDHEVKKRHSSYTEAVILL